MEDYTLYKVKTVSRCHELIAGYKVEDQKQKGAGAGEGGGVLIFNRGVSLC